MICPHAALGEPVCSVCLRRRELAVAFVTEHLPQVGLLAARMVECPHGAEVTIAVGDPLVARWCAVCGALQLGPDGEWLASYIRVRMLELDREGPLKGAP